MGALKIGIVGGGTVGGGIVEILGRKGPNLKSSLGLEFDICKIAVRDASKPRDFALPAGCEVTSDFKSIIDDDEIDLVVEVMGGTTLAKEVVVEALKKGKHVVTANKALIAADLAEIDALVAEVNKGKDSPVMFGYEAAVCGGIPIIHALQTDFLGDDVTQLSGIINGCTNFMLSNMAKGGLTYAEALAEASRLGYAEADPTLDVGGFDARSKLRIMIKLAFGVDVNEEDIPCRGITEVSKTDFEYAATLDGTVKLLGVAKLDDKKPGKMTAFVSPVFVPNDDTLSKIEGATNAVEILSESLMKSLLVGPGAGRFPTANSIVSDILNIAQGKCGVPFPKAPSGEMTLINTYESKFYIRIRYRDELGITAKLGSIFQERGVSIYSLLQNPISNTEDVQFVVTTDMVDVTAVKKACADLEAESWCLGTIFYMPIL